MNGFLLAAGRGTRLGHLTQMRAKPALPVAELPMLAYSLHFFYRAQVQKLAVNVHHAPQTVTDILQRAPHPWQLFISNETELLDTGGGVKKCEAFLSDASVLLANADIVCDVDIERLVQQHRAQKASLTMVVVPHTNANAIAPITVTKDGRVRDINRTLDKKSTGDFLYAGIALFERELFDHLKCEPSSIVYTGFTGLLEKGARVDAFLHRGHWYDCGTPENYERVNAEILKDEAHWREYLAPELDTLRITT